VRKVQIEPASDRKETEKIALGVHVVQYYHLMEN